MAFGAYLAELGGELAFAVEEKGGAFDLDDGLAVHGGIAHNVELLGDFEFGIGQQGVGQVVFIGELFLLLLRVARDAEKDRAGGFEFAVDVAELAGFNGAAGCVGTRIEEEHDRRAAELRKGDAVAVLVVEREVDGIADLHGYLPLEL